MASGGEPDYALDENKKPGFVRVRVEIPNLKAKGGQGFLSRFIGGRRDEAKNAKIYFNAEERSFTLKVNGDSGKGMEGKSWMIQISKLPHLIDQSSSHIETEDGFVNVFLKKASADDDWSSYIRKGQLEA